LVLGAAYKPDVNDLRESPALDVIALLAEKGADVSYHDPYCPSLKSLDGVMMESVADMFSAVEKADCVVIITDHSEYEYGAVLEKAQLIVDTRNALGKAGRNNPKVFGL